MDGIKKTKVDEALIIIKDSELTLIEVYKQAIKDCKELFGEDIIKCNPTLVQSYVEQQLKISELTIDYIKKK